jgi:hypothetical protein
MRHHFSLRIHVESKTPFGFDSRWSWYSCLRAVVFPLGLGVPSGEHACIRWNGCGGLWNDSDSNSPSRTLI